MNKRLFYRVIVVVIALGVAAVAMELLAQAYLYARDRRYVSARERLQTLDNTFIAGITRGQGGCSYVDTIYPHPYLAFVHHGNPPCGIADINNIGLFGPDYPDERPADRFVVLVTGGSVAAQMLQAGPQGAPYLQTILERDYVSPTGQPFLVLNGGDGAWHQPQQLILFVLYADAVHGVVTLDGFNERYFIGSGVRFEYPANHFLDVNPLVSSTYSTIVKRWLIAKFYGRLRDNALLSRSQAAYLVFARLDAYLKQQQESYTARERTNLNTMMAVPESWDQEHRVAWGTGQYRKYIQAMDAIAAQNGVLAAHFIQPVPAISKPLTDEERMAVGDLGYRDQYQRITRDVLALADQGTPIFSLLDLFEQDQRPLYADAIHLRQAPDGSSVGYELMARRMATVLAQTWRLQPKQAPSHD